MEKGLRWLVPVGRSGWSIAAGYLTLLSCVPFIGLPFGIAALVTGILGLRAASRQRRLGGRGRALFGVIVGGITVVVNALGLVALLISKTGGAR
jgi:hypothetical protein